MRRRRLVTVVGLLLAASGCNRPAAPAPAASSFSAAHAPAAQPAPPAQPFERLDIPSLPNAYRVHAKVITGAEPAGAAGFEALARLGIRTILSVDGAQPDLEAARALGLRYVHLPLGYDGIPPDKALQLAKAVRELEGPIYMHCHHGKHRSPAAAAVACVAAGMLEPERAVPLLETAGTSPAYQGLYLAAQQARRVNAATLAALQVRYVEAANPPDMVRAMVKLDHTFDRIKLIAKADWKTPADHPDLSPAHEALLLREHFAELLRMPEVQQQPEDYRRLLRESETDARLLERALAAGQDAADSARTNAELPAILGRLTTHCIDCHQRYRD